MKNRLLYLLMLFAAHTLCAQTSELTFNRNSFTIAHDNITPYLGSYNSEWPADANGEEEAALIRIKVENATQQEIAAMSFRFPSQLSIAERVNKLELAEVWLFVNAVKLDFIEATLDGYGSSAPFTIAQRLEPRGIYKVTLVNTKTVTLSIESNPSGATVVLDGVEQRLLTPLQIEDVTMGSHKISLSLNGKLLKEKVITASDDNIHFAFDLRKTRSIRIESSPSNADVYLNGAKTSSGKTPLTLTLPYDSYQIVAKVDNTQSDTLNTTIDELSHAILSLFPVRKKQVTVAATYFGKPVVADLDVDDMYYGAQQTNYYLSLPYGSHRLRMTYNGKYKEKRVRINKNSDSQYNIAIPTRNAFVWPWHKEYDADAMGFSLSYVQKQLVYTDENDDKQAYNTWGEEDKWVQGVQVGIYFQPTFSWGLGLHTGLFYEYYTSTNDNLTDVDDFNLYTEHALYMPAHLYFRLPFAEQVALAVHGGLGINCGLTRSIACKDEESYYAPIELAYGTTEYSKQLSLASELSLALRLYTVQLHATYSQGLVDSNRDVLEHIPSQNKITIGLSWVFGSTN